MMELGRMFLVCSMLDRRQRPREAKSERRAAASDTRVWSMDWETSMTLTI